MKASPLGSLFRFLAENWRISLHSSHEVPEDSAIREAKNVIAAGTRILAAKFHLGHARHFSLFLRRILLFTDDFAAQIAEAPAIRRRGETFASRDMFFVTFALPTRPDKSDPARRIIVLFDLPISLSIAAS